ncbi:MAG: ABC transporter substrate-binding protein [candidate division KSB1 bacterium]|nr:ABC transporter substrate-binding protein [candidate division KSB1 bacterium]MDZ7335326.1 ABC transporter substrate-binding protein [candidate division KSB1 bacterium]MDZ7356799.1 ABC transporter substrate-binding protein [candidate division KSB1 bacterium]MDZ7375545.1 ABC transporter substrate-binding protein [candidate division KSB1 bacterium]MDZ7399012.1 ABC transporter substrate-binding protein [candidate division KSB1 bacterium]
MIRKIFWALLIMLIVWNCAGRSKKNKPQILVSPKGLVHSFWVTVKAGADSAGKEFNADVIWKGPTQETDIAGQIAIIEDYVNKGVDAIVLAACDAQGLIPVLEKAQQRGIPVITIDSGVDSDLPISFIATDNILAAQKAAQKLAELIGEQGKVACIPFIPGAATSNWREQGFVSEIKKYPNIALLPIRYSQSEVAVGMAVTEDILTAHPDLKGIFAANEAGTIGVIQALKSKNKIGQVRVVGFDAAPNEVKALQAGEVDALIVQDPFKMGYEGVKAAIKVLAGEVVPRRIDTGVYIVTRENLDQPEIQRLIR